MHQTNMDDIQFNLLRNHANRSITWLDENLERFYPIVDPKDTSSLQAFSELSLLYVYLAEWKDEFSAFPSKKWMDFILKNIERPDFAQMARKRPSITFSFILPYLMMRSIGYRSEYYEDTLKFLDEWAFFRSIEVVPYRVLDLEFMYWKSGYREQDPNWIHLFNQTLLARCKDPLFLDDEAAYSITHTLFYLTDFGNHPLILSNMNSNRMTDIVECLLVHYLRVQNWDILGELLINLNVLSQQSPLYKEAAKGFLQAWNEDGSVPPKALFRKEKDDFWTCYHTTLVGMLFCGTAIKNNKLKKGVLS